MASAQDRAAGEQADARSPSSRVPAPAALAREQRARALVEEVIPGFIVQFGADFVESQRDKYLETARNQVAYEDAKEKMVRDHKGKWVLFMDGAFAGAAEDYEELAHRMTKPGFLTVAGAKEQIWEC
jgi:hypothetical protein